MAAQPWCVGARDAVSDRAYIGALVAIAALVALVLLVTRPPPDVAEGEEAAVEVADAEPSAAQPGPRGDKTPPAELTPQPSVPAAVPVEALDAGSIHDVGAAAPDAGPDTAVAAPAWADPVNARVLGPQNWMAPDDEVEDARIDAVFEQARAASHDPRMDDRARASSIVAAKKVVDACFEALRQRAPAQRGRLIVAWRAESRAGQGLIVSPRVTNKVGLREPAFEACIVDGLRERPFGPAEGEPIEVEAPFFYDGSY